MIPKNIKKWIRVSDEAIAMGGEILVRYIYDELTYQIVKKLTELVIADIAGAPTTATSSAAAVSAMGYAGELAHSRLTEMDGNSTYRNYIIDAISNMTPEMLEKGANYEVR